MCIGMPLRAIDVWPGGALVEGRGRRERIDTRLVGDVAAGQWMLVFQGAARERIDAGRAAEVNAALDLLDAALAGDQALASAEDPGFELPSRWNAAQLAVLAGRALADLAGIHFDTLTAGRYRFSDDGKFDIVDLSAADQVLSAESLSGGESFLASLALALALSLPATGTARRLR